MDDRITNLLIQMYDSFQLNGIAISTEVQENKTSADDM